MSFARAPRKFSRLIFVGFRRPGALARYFVMPLITTVSLLGNRLSQLIYVTSVPNGEGECKSSKININARNGEIRAVRRTGESIFYVAVVNG